MNKNIHHLFKTNASLLDNVEVQELIEYCRDLEGQVLERKVEDNYSKEETLRSMLLDILVSCKEYQENKIVQERYPELGQKLNADDLVKNLMDYILSMNIKNNLRLE